MPLALLAGALTLVYLPAQEPGEKVDPLLRRYGLEADAIKYSQKTPTDTMRSVVKAYDAGRIDYLLAHLTEPKFVDKRVAEYKQRFTQGSDDARTLLSFNRFIAETDDHFRDDPLLVRELRLFAKEAEWEEKDDATVGTSKAAPARKVYLRKIGERYFLENRQQ